MMYYQGTNITWERAVKKILFHRAQRRHDMPGKQLDRLQGFGEGQITEGELTDHVGAL